MIRKTKKGYKVISHKGKNLSKDLKTKAEAEERLAEVEMFKHINKQKGSMLGYRGH